MNDSKTGGRSGVHGERPSKHAARVPIKIVFCLLSPVKARLPGVDKMTVMSENRSLCRAQARRDAPACCPLADIVGALKAVQVAG
jgi:hypothetical protein